MERKNVYEKSYEWMGFVIKRSGNHYIVTNPNKFKYIHYDDVIRSWTEDTVEDAKETIREYWISRGYE